MPRLDWIGRKAVENHHRQVPFHLLKEVPELSVGDPGSGNLLVEGDNLLALKALLPYYAGQVKCIYIDPPYNTGNENWIYNDNVNSPEMKAWLGKIVGKEAEDLSRHDKWLCMMYPRLVLLRRFLCRNGVILISIDDFEVINLRVLMDEIFGRENFVAQLVWEKGRKNDAKLFSIGHEYVVVYALSLSYLRQKKTIWREAKPGAREIHDEYLQLKETHGNNWTIIEEELRKFYKNLPKGHPSKKHARYGNVDDRGVWRDDNMSWPGGGGPRYDVIHPVTKKACTVPEGGWRYATPEKMNEMISKGVVQFRADEKEPPIRKTYLVRGNGVKNDDIGEEDIGRQVMGSYFYRSALQASNTLLSIFGEKLFENPKDHEILARLVRYVTNEDRNAVILDSFAGSGTTGHAVMQLNREDGGNRRCILVEMDTNICRNVTAERLRRVSQGYKNAKGEDVAGLGGSFRFATLGDPLFDERGNIRKTVKFPDLARHVYFTETGEPLPDDSLQKTTQKKWIPAFAGMTAKVKSGITVKTQSPLIGFCNGIAVYLLYNGILKDKTPNGGNVLTTAVLSHLPKHDGPKVIYGTACRIGQDRLRRENITFKQLPYKIRVT